VTRRKPKSESELRLEYPTLETLTGPKSSAGTWIAAFKVNPDATYALVADMIKQVHAKSGRVGQRPMPKEDEVDLDALIHGDTTDLPLTEALRKLITVSEREFARRAYLSKTQARRLREGSYHPDINELRQIAAALGKPPAYFVEYRKAMAVAAFVGLLDERPGIATRLYRQYLEVRA